MKNNLNFMQFEGYILIREIENGLEIYNNEGFWIICHNPMIIEDLNNVTIFDNLDEAVETYRKVKISNKMFILTVTKKINLKKLKVD